MSDADPSIPSDGPPETDPMLCLLGPPPIGAGENVRDYDNLCYGRVEDAPPRAMDVTGKTLQITCKKQVGALSTAASDVLHHESVGRNKRSALRRRANHPPSHVAV